MPLIYCYKCWKKWAQNPLYVHLNVFLHTNLQRKKVVTKTWSSKKEYNAFLLTSYLYRQMEIYG